MLWELNTEHLEWGLAHSKLTVTIISAAATTTVVTTEASHHKDPQQFLPVPKIQHKPLAKAVRSVPAASSLHQLMSVLPYTAAHLCLSSTPCAHRWAMVCQSHTCPPQGSQACLPTAPRAWQSGCWSEGMWVGGLQHPCFLLLLAMPGEKALHYVCSSWASI